MLTIRAPTSPLLCDAVGVAAVVHEAGKVPLGPGVDHPIAVYGEVVVVLLAGRLVSSHPSAVLRHGDQLAHVLDHEPTGSHRLLGLKHQVL